MAHPTNKHCSTCGAQPGHPCKDLVWNYPVAGFHDARKG